MLFKDDQVARSQHNAVRTNVGWHKWTHDLVEVKGNDAAGFLDYLYVNSIAKTLVGSSKYTTMLNELGQITDDVIVMHISEGVYWVSTLYAPQLVSWMDEYVADLDVVYRDITKEKDMFSIQGPNSKSIVNQLVSAPVDSMEKFSMIDAKINGIEVTIHKGGFTGEDGYEIYCGIGDSDVIKAAIDEAGKEMSSIELTILEVYVRSLPVEKGFALRQDIYGLSPYECGLGWSVDLSKDFIGKEAALQVKEEGARRLLTGIEYEAESYEDICQRERVYHHGTDIGFIRAAIYGYTVDKNIGFAVVQADKAVPGTKVTVGPNRSPAVIARKRWV